MAVGRVVEKEKKGGKNKNDLWVQVVPVVELFLSTDSCHGQEADEEDVSQKTLERGCFNFKGGKFTSTLALPTGRCTT